MAFKITWSPKAISNLEDIANFIAKDSEYYGKLFVQKIIQLIRKLSDFPQFGRVVPEYNKENIREIIYQNYRIVYRVKETSIEIATVTHGAKKFNPSNDKSVSI